MAPGSIVEVTKDLTGTCLVNGKEVKLLPALKKGDIFVIDELLPKNYAHYRFEDGITLVEVNHVMHPVVNQVVAYVAKFFRELLPPEEVDIEQLMDQTVKA